MYFLSTVCLVTDFLQGKKTLKKRLLNIVQYDDPYHHHFAEYINKDFDLIIIINYHLVTIWPVFLDVLVSQPVYVVYIFFLTF